MNSTCLKAIIFVWINKSVKIAFKIVDLYLS